MDEEKNETSFLTMLLRAFATTFSWAILAMCVVGMLNVRYSPATRYVPAFFDFDGAGIPFASILQIAGFSLVMAFFVVLLFSERFFPKMRYFWRTLFLCLATLLTCSVFVLIFGWFPADNIRSWLGFVPATISCFALSFALLRLKHKLEGRKYDRLLANYKARRKPQPTTAPETGSQG